jgi:hypothetical protein
MNIRLIPTLMDFQITPRYLSGTGLHFIITEYHRRFQGLLHPSFLRFCKFGKC